MSRLQRARSKSGYYHIMLRGNEKKNIFLNEEDKLRFIETIYRMKQEQRFYLHAFCLEALQKNARGERCVKDSNP